MQTMGIKYIVLDKNIDWLARSTDNPVQVMKILDLSPDLTLINQVGSLKLYALNTRPNQEISVANRALSVISPNNLLNINLNPIWASLSEGEIFFTQNPNPDDLANKQLILPMRQVIKNIGETSSTQESPKSYANFLPGSFLYNLVLFKEGVENLLISSNIKLSEGALLTTKRLGEVEKLAEYIDDPNLTNAINSYSSYLDKYLGDNYSVDGARLTGDQLLQRQIILSKEKETLQNLINKVEKNQLKVELKNDVSKITSFQQKEGLEIYYPSVYDAYKNLLGQQIHTYLFNVSHKDSYEILFDIVNPQSFNFSVDSTLPVYIDGVLTKVTFKSYQGSLFSLGAREFSAGIHEISIPAPKAISLIDKDPQLLQKHGLIESVDQNHYKMSSTADYSYISFPINNYSQNKLYKLNLSYRIILGNGPTVDILQDSDLFKNYNDPHIRWNFFNDKYNYDYKNFRISFSNGNYTWAKLEDKTTNPQIRISIPFWNNCEEVNFQKKSICLNPAIKREYNKQSVIEIKNLDIEESFSGNLLLAKNNPGNINYQLPKIEFNKFSPTEYKVHFNNPNDKFYLVLNESFSDGWQAILQGKGEAELILKKEHILANGYANGWVINKSGAGDITIRYLPQTYLIKGVYISITTFLIILVLFGLEVVLRKKKF